MTFYLWHVTPDPQASPLTVRLDGGKDVFLTWRAGCKGHTTADAATAVKFAQGVDKIYLFFISVYVLV